MHSYVIYNVPVRDLSRVSMMASKVFDWKGQNAVACALVLIWCFCPDHWFLFYIDEMVLFLWNSVVCLTYVMLNGGCETYRSHDNYMFAAAFGPTKLTKHDCASLGFLGQRMPGLERWKLRECFWWKLQGTKNDGSWWVKRLKGPRFQFGFVTCSFEMRHGWRTGCMDINLWCSYC